MKRRLLFKVAVALFALVVLEAGSRVVLRLGAGVPLTTPGRALEVFYPRLARLRTRGVPAGDGTIDLLLLGGSVLDERWSAVPLALAEEVERLTGQPVLLHIAAQRGQTTRDSAVLYEALGGRAYDAVVVYHGINDVRAGAIAAERFDGSYAHLRRYRDLDTLLRYQNERALALPFALASAANDVADLVGWSDLVADGEPPPDLAVLAADHKTVPAFRANLAQIAGIAARRGQPVVLMTFATYVPEDYSRTAFEGRRLDYGRHRSAVEWWGVPKVVVGCVAAHNEVVRELAADDDRLRLVDQAATLPSDGATFDDVCHLTLAGSVRFARIAAPVIREAVSGTAGDQE